MATQPTDGGSAGTWGAELNAFTAVSLDPATGKVKNEALQVASTAPVADAALANKKYVDDAISTALGSAKAWVVFDGTGASPITKADGYNISGTITKNSTGNYTVAWTTPFSTANYAVVGMASFSGQATSIYQISQAASTFTFGTSIVANTPTDCDHVSLTAFGQQ